jgi:NlpC/P60 family putative phage cell wall peptidase
MTEAQERAAVVSEARSWLGTPYHHQGMVKGVGVDCAQILIGVFSNVGLCEREVINDYPHDWHLHHSDELYLGHIKRFLKPTTKAAQPGDVALFKFGRCISHAAIVIDWPTVIHSYVRQGVVLGRVDGMELTGRLAGIWTYWGDQ